MWPLPMHESTYVKGRKYHSHSCSCQAADVVFLDPPRTSTSPVEQEMLEHGTLTGEDLDILTFGSALPNLGPNFHSPEALLAAVDYFQEYNARASACARPATSYDIFHLPPDPERRALERQLQRIEQECRAENNTLADAVPLDHSDIPYADGCWSYPDFKTDEPCEGEVPDEISLSRVDEDDPDPFFVNEEVRSDNLGLADIPEHITVIHAVVSWLHLQFHLLRIACNALLAILTLLLMFLSPSATTPFATLQSGNRLLGVDVPVYTLPVCPVCRVYTPRPRHHFVMIPAHPAMLISFFQGRRCGAMPGD
ncbi:hypothetical protein EV401DRAFT_1500878 [Pisolithus croceorrhizus]|nr:hypothetical protein EV401DRAFT_1500878 [Pisolithus croceorrhizus]